MIDPGASLSSIPTSALCAKIGEPAFARQDLHNS